MANYVGFALLGLGAGALYAVLALGLVITYQSSGVVNFAHGAMATYAAYTFLMLYKDGELLSPFPGPDTVHIGDLPFVVCLVAALVVAALLALVLYLLVFRPIRNSSALVKVVASVGLMVVLQAIVQIKAPNGTQSLPPILPSEGVSLFGVNIARDRLWLALLVIVLTGVLMAFYRYTRFGLATRAVAQSEKGALLLGYSPTLLGAVNWMAGGCLGALVGIVLIPITGLDPTNFTLFIVPALGAALVANFTSLPIAVIAGLLIGVVQSVTQKLVLDFEWLPRVGLTQAVPFVVIVVVMALHGKGLPDRGSVVTASLPRAFPSRRPFLYLGIAGVVILVSGALLQGSYRVSLITSLVGALLCLSLVVSTGFLGQTSLAQMMFAGVGGFVVARLSSEVGIPFPIAPILAGFVAMGIGLLLGLPALRVRGVNLAILTIGAALAVHDLVFLNPSYTGALGGSKAETPRLFGINLGISGDAAFDYPRYAFVATVLVFVLLVFAPVVNLRRSVTGRQMLAVRSSERAAEACGVNVRAMKLYGFALSAFIAGVAGAMLGYQQGQVSAAGFTAFASLALLSTAFIGGIANVSGAVIGGLVFANGLLVVGVDRFIPLSPNAHELLAGLLVVWYAIVHPTGGAGAILNKFERRRSRGERVPTPVPAPSLPAELEGLAR